MEYERLFLNTMPIRLKKRNTVILVTLLLFFLVVYSWIGGSNDKNSVSEFAEQISVVRTTVDEVSIDDPFQSFLIHEDRIYNKAGKVTCLEKRNYVFIKTMKCATQTLVQMFRRFGYRRNLNFVLPRQNRIYLGWPFIPESQDYRASSRPFNALVEHSVYNETVFTKLMPKDTVYVTIIREPWSHFKSAFSYFNVANISRVKESSNRMSAYLKNIDSYEQFYKSEEGSATRFCIPNGFSVTKNLMSHCLGMPLGFPAGRENITSDLTKVRDYIETLDRNFGLIMLMEYFHESLVLLKRVMCWSLEDILYHTSNVGTYSNKFTLPDPKDYEIVRKWNSIDFMLYDHFNQTFWKKVKTQGDDFFPEVAVFNSLQARVKLFCSDENHSGTPVTMKANQYHGDIVLNKDYCLLLGVDLLMLLKNRADFQEDYSEHDATQVQGVKRGC